MTPTRDVHASTPILAQLGRIASTVRRQYWPDGDLPLGLTHEELVNEGWLAYVTAKRQRWARARWAMVDLMRSVHAPVSGRMNALRRSSAVPLTDDLQEPEGTHATSPVRASRLRRGDIEALRTAVHRTLSESRAAVAIACLIDGESIELVAERTGRTRELAVMIRAQAFGDLLKHCHRA